MASVLEDVGKPAVPIPKTPSNVQPVPILQRAMMMSAYNRLPIASDWGPPNSLLAVHAVPCVHKYGAPPSDPPRVDCGAGEIGEHGAARDTDNLHRVPLPAWLLLHDYSRHHRQLHMMAKI